MAGDIVGVFPGNSGSQSERDQLCSGTVSCVKAKFIEVAFDLDVESIDLNDTDSYKLLRLANDVTFRRLKG